MHHGGLLLAIALGLLTACADGPESPRSSVTPAVHMGSDARSRYLLLLRAHLEHFKRYPAASLRAREEGTVVVKFVLDRVGHVIDAKVDKSSGFSGLDLEALTMLYRSQPLPVLPLEIEGERVTIELPIMYALSRR